MKTLLSNAIAALSAALLATLTYSAHAQAAQPDPADPRMPVPAPRYQSAFDSYRPSTDETPSPAKNWRALNENIAIHGSMGMDMGMDMKPGGMSMPMKGTHEDEMKGMNHGGAKGGGMKGMQKDDPKGTVKMPMTDSGKGMQHAMPMPNDASQKR